ncbi:hypothetical protein GIS01_15195 [Aeromonas veronii]|nr:hypothetical protein GIS01_15195 [Aeromonas veronii]
MSDEQKEYCYSWNDELFDSGTFGSIEDALADAVENSDDGDVGWRTEVYIAEAIAFKNSTFYPDASWVLEHMGERAWGEIGECADEYPDVSKEAREDLDAQLSAMLDSWCEKHGVSPQFYRVRNSKLYQLPSAAA